MLQFYFLGTFLVLGWLVSLILHGKTPVWEKSKQHNAQRLLLITLPSLVIALYFIGLKPFNAGGDTAAYLSAYSRIHNPFTATEDAAYGTEMLFWPVQSILKTFLSPRGWFIAHYLIACILTYAAYKKLTNNTRLSPLLFALAFTTFYAVYSGNVMRQMYSIPLGLIALHYFHQKHLIKFLAFSALAISFHWSAFIIIFYPFITRIPNETKYYTLIPIAALLSSPLIDYFSEILIELTDFNWLAVKSELYIRGGKISHIEAVWKTMNFWLCIIVYACLILTKAIIAKPYQAIAKYHLMVISLMLFSIRHSDISERYMPWIIFSIPLSVAILLSSTKLPTPLKNTLYLGCFSIMAILVFTRPSTIETLGIYL